jgi:hypothetical protein
VIDVETVPKQIVKGRLGVPSHPPSSILNPRCVVSWGTPGRPTAANFVPAPFSKSLIH